MTTDTIADVLTRIRNAQRANHKSVRMAVSKGTLSVLEQLLAEGFIEYIETVSVPDSIFQDYEVGLKYFANGQPCITKAVRVSKPGKRVYTRVKDIPVVNSGLGMCLLSTSEGVISGREARKRNIGGEVIALIG
jgi:small subunit ribosomal protein S8